MRGHRRRLRGADLCGVLRKRRSVALRCVGIRRVPGLRAGGRENPVVRVVRGHQGGLLEKPVVHRESALFGFGLQNFGRDGLLSHAMQTGRHAPWGGDRHQHQSEDGDAQGSRFGHGAHDTEASDDEADDPQNPSPEGVGQGQFEAAADEVNVLLVHSRPKEGPAITLIETKSSCQPVTQRHPHWRSVAINGSRWAGMHWRLFHRRSPHRRVVGALCTCA